MINLLPPAEKQRLFGEEKWKITVIFGFISVIFFTSLILILVSINLSVLFQLKAQNVVLEGKKAELGAAGIQGIVQKVKKANQDISSLNYFYSNKISMVSFLEKLSALLPKGISLNDISINPLDQKNFQVAISGHAQSVENVISFRDNLLAEKYFSNTVFPQETWFEKIDFNFDATFQAIIQK
jgi:Tfp pilus assembly protein PilN